MEQFFRSHPEVTQKYPEKALEGRTVLTKCLVESTNKPTDSLKDSQSKVKATQLFVSSLHHRNTYEELTKSEQELDDDYLSIITSRFDKITIKGEKVIIISIVWIISNG